LARLTLKPIEEAMETQNRFTADASHELRTPLTAMRTEIEVALRDRELGLNESKKLFESNLEEIGKLESLSSALLKLAKNGDTKLALEKVNLAEIITEAYEKVEREAEKKSIMIDFDANKYGDLEINGDRLSLTELFVILLDNAIKYSSEKSKISINIEKDHDKTIIRVKDHGVGINHSDLPYIFNRFYRADSSRSKEKVSGYGLGLSIAKQIVELHSGNITVVSKPGKGTEFTVKI
jgi:signal transduction histidine kinase